MDNDFLARVLEQYEPYMVSMKPLVLQGMTREQVAKTLSSKLAKMLEYAVNGIDALKESDEQDVLDTTLSLAGLFYIIKEIHKDQEEAKSEAEAEAKQ